MMKSESRELGFSELDIILSPTSRRREGTALTGSEHASPLVLMLERVPTVLGAMLLVSDEQACLRALDWLDFDAPTDVRGPPAPPCFSRPGPAG